MSTDYICDYKVTEPHLHVIQRDQVQIDQPTVFYSI